jgi:hypothetical protein
MAKSSQFAPKESVRDMLVRMSNEATQEFDLPSGIKCHINFFSGKKARIAQEIATNNNGVDEDLLWGAIISECCLFNGEKLIAEDISLLNGIDYMVILGKLGGVQSTEDK